jgi:hypothetical protein
MKPLVSSNLLKLHLFHILSASILSINNLLLNSGKSLLQRLNHKRNRISPLL